MRTLLLILLALLLGPPAQGSGPWESLRPPMRVFGLQDGLPNTTVYTVKLDHRGGLWVGTQDGLARFNGRTWTVVKLPSVATTNYVRTLAETPDGSLWIGTELGGLWRHKQAEWTHFSREGEFPSDRINTLHVLQEPGGGWSLLVGTGGGGIATFKEEAWTFAHARSGLPSDWVWKFTDLPGMNGKPPRTVAATTAGFAVLEGGAWRTFDEIPGLPTQETNDLAVVDGPRGPELWLSVWNRGLMHWDGRSWEEHRPETGFPSRFPVTLGVSRRPGGGSILWVATYDHGLAWREDGTWRNLDAAGGLPSNGVYSLLVPPAGEPTLWAGLRGGGLVALDLTGWYSLDRMNGLPSDEVLSFATPKGSEVPWIGTAKGVLHWTGHSWAVEDERHGLPSLRIQALCAAWGREGLWAGTVRGLAFREGGRWRPRTLQVPLKDPRILCLLETAGEGAGPILWVGTEGGLLKVEQARTRLITVRDGLPLNLVYSLLETRDAQGRPTLWVGTRGGGVARLSEGRWIHHGREAGLPNLSVYGMGEHRTADGRRWLWAGTFGGGAARLDLDRPDASWEVFNSKVLPDLPSDVVVKAETDHRGRLYLITQRGVARLRFEDAKDPSRPTGVDTFGQGDGLAPVSCSYGAAVVDPGGRIWVATHRGAAALDPDRENMPAPLPSLMLDSVQVAGVPFDPGAPISLRQGGGPVQVEFALPHYRRTEDLRFRTQLLGEEREPSAWSPEGRRELTALGAGRFVLRGWAKDWLGRVAGPVDVAIVVRPPWWAHPAAQGLYVAVLVGVLLLVIRLRTRLLQERARELQARVQEATLELEARRQQLERLNEEKNAFIGITAHDLRNPLSTLGLLADELALGDLTPGEVQVSADRIHRSVDQMTTFIANLLDVSRIESGLLRLQPERVDLRMVAGEMQIRHAAKAEAKGLVIEVHAPWDEVPAWVDLESLREVLDNLVSNALKFTPPGPPRRIVDLRVFLTDGHACIEVVDQGPGFTAQDRAKVFQRFAKLSARPTAGESSTGLGLSIVHSLAEAMGGHVELYDTPGGGATFRLVFPQPFTGERAPG